MKKLIFVSVLSILFLVSLSISFAQELTEKERKIYQEAVDVRLRALFVTELDEAEDELDRVTQKVADKYGITIDKLQDIVDRAIAKKVTPREVEISDEISQRTSDMPISPEDYKRVFEETARKYGISVDETKEIYYRAILSLLPKE